MRTCAGLMTSPVSSSCTVTAGLQQQQHRRWQGRAAAVRLGRSRNFGGSRAPLTVRAAAFDKDTQRQPSRLPAPPAPPTFVPPPPPVPPPKPPPGQLGGLNISRKGLLAIMLAGGLAEALALRKDLPATLSVNDRLTYVKTKGGWPLAVSMDERGRLYMFDAAGNLFYDTGDKRLGWNMVDSGGNVYNLFVPQNDPQQRVQKRLLGTMGDMVSVPITEIGGIPVERIQKELKMRGNEVVGFAGGPPVLYPPEAPLIPRRTGQVDSSTGAEIVTLEPAPFLEEGAVVPYQSKSGGGGALSWLFGGKKPPTLLDQMRGLERGN